MEQSIILSPEEVSNRIESVKKLLAYPEIIPIILFKEELVVECLIVPAISESGSAQPPMFIYPGGNTHLAPCFEHSLYLDRTIIIPSPLGYGNSSNAPRWIFKKDFLYGAEVALRVLEYLGIDKVEIFVHSNAGPIGGMMVLLAEQFEIKITGITFSNPLGLRRLSRIAVALAFVISGALSNIAAWGYKNPYKQLKSAYRLPDSQDSLIQQAYNNWRNLLYELDKSSEPRLLNILKAINLEKIFIPVTLVQSTCDWAALMRWPWKKSNKQIFEENIPKEFFRFERIWGLHNATLGRQSRNLAGVMANPARIFSLAIICLPQLPAILDCLHGSLRIIYG